ncbi:type I restriction enzyme endonuclease domain-containing protein, partial [Thiolapillus sp.]|uniref:type I restriction enzyme endonuclease domain-containing protein n=2 Tax=Thiolapillus sp. TaxID=2017437 RepID=UPI003AF6A7E4
MDKPMKGHGLMQAIARTNRIWKDKPGGLVVDYIGIGEELKNAIRQYTQASGTTKSPVDVSGEALKILLDTLDVIRKEFFHGFDYSGHKDPQQALALLGPAMEHITKLNPEADERGRNKGVKECLDQVAKLTKAQALAGTHAEAIAVRDESKRPRIDTFFQNTISHRLSPVPPQRRRMPWPRPTVLTASP